MRTVLLLGGPFDGETLRFEEGPFGRYLARRYRAEAGTMSIAYTAFYDYVNDWNFKYSHSELVN